MQTIGNITGYVDLAQILLYVFWLEKQEVLLPE